MEKPKKSSKTTTAKSTITGKKNVRVKTVPATSQKNSPVRKDSSQGKKSAEKAASPAIKQPKALATSKKENTISTEEKIRRVGDKLSVAADRGVEVLKEVFGKVRDFSVDAAELTKLKVDIHRLKGDKDRMLTVMGEKLWELRNSDKLDPIRSIFAEDFDKIQELNAQIDQKESAAKKITL